MWGQEGHRFAKHWRQYVLHVHCVHALACYSACLLPPPPFFWQETWVIKTSPDA